MGRISNGVWGGTEIEWDDGRINGVFKTGVRVKKPLCFLSSVYSVQDEVLLNLARNRQTDESGE